MIFFDFYKHDHGESDVIFLTRVKYLLTRFPEIPFNPKKYLALQ